jgi:thiamine biosynthesis lipoprotein
MSLTTSGRIGRRRAITILAASAGAALLPGLSRSSVPARFEWRGRALGAPARLILHGPDRAAAAAAVAACVAEVERLEYEFSLYRSDSALSRLNRHGRLDAPSHDMRRLLLECQRFGALSNGAFDVTVQPLWSLYAAHFAANPAATDGPPPEALAAALDLVDYRRLRVADDHVALPKGMSLTLNGIAQGYITDRVADLLRARGWHHVLVDMGEIRALDTRPDGQPWLIGLDAAGQVPISGQAVATSAGSGTPLAPDGRTHHLFDPRTGRSANTYRSVTVVAARATAADVLSSAIYVAPPAEAARLLHAGGGIEARLIDNSGQVQRLSAAA